MTKVKLGKKYTLKEKELLKIEERASYNALKQFEKKLMESACEKLYFYIESAILRTRLV